MPLTLQLLSDATFAGEVNVFTLISDVEMPPPDMITGAIRRQFERRAADEKMRVAEPMMPAAPCLPL